MINLTNHMCYHCRSMNRYQRTIHGNFQKAILHVQKEIAYCVDSLNFGRVSYLRQKESRLVASMKYFEKHPYSNFKYDLENQKA